MNKINSSQLTPNSYIYVRGNVEFSRLTRFLTSEEAAREKARREKFSNFPNMPDKPFTTITVTNARIQQMNPGAPLTLEEQYIQDKFYSTKNDSSMHYQIENKSNNFPRFYQVKINPDGSVDPKHATEVPAQAELDRGLDVLLILRVYKPKNFANCGIGLEGVIAQEAIRYYSGGGAVSHLAQMGITVDAQLSDEERKAAQEKAASARTPVMAAPETDDTPAMPTPVQAPVGNPYSAQAQAATPAPAQNNFMNQPTTDPAMAPVTNDTWKCASCGTENAGKFCNNCGAKKPEANANPNPYVSQDVIGQAQGIRFDPNDMSRNY